VKETAMQAIDARIRRWLVWLVPFAAVALLLGWETDWGRALTPEPRADAPVKAQPVSVALLPEFKLDGGTEARRETVERTLFNPTRRPAPPAPAANAQQAAMAKGTFTLAGTSVTDGSATAFLREVNGGKVRRVRKGETVNGMLVEDVKADRVRLAQGGEIEELTLRVAAGPKTTIQPAQPHVQQAGAPPQGAAAQAAAQNAPQPPLAQEVAEVLAQRRRAARAAEAQAARQQQGQQQGQTATQGARPAPSAAAPQPGASNSPTPTADTGWAAVYQRMQQRR
jgi:hypothetical protein